ETADGDRMAGWDLQDYPGAATFADRQVHHGGGQSLRMEGIDRADPQNGQARLMQTVSVAPFRQYHLSVWIKTQDFETPQNAGADVLTPSGHDLAYVSWDIRRTQDWTQYHAVFNSLDNRQVRVFLGVWEGKGGRIWWDDAQLEEVGLLNVLRRDGCPLTARGEDGTVYAEGQDFAPVLDPSLDRARSTGSYDVYHAPPVLRLIPHSRLKAGQRLRVSFFSAVILYDGQVPCCLSEPKVYTLLQAQIQRAWGLFHPAGFFLSHDEIRVANWCETCLNRHLTPGQILADNVQRCVGMVRAVAPKARILIWSDMFDPYHNAHDDYFLVNGTWAGSWEGLPKDIIVVNWNFPKRGQSLPWFAGRGVAQLLAGNRDGSPERIRTWLEDAPPSVVGAMYTTWQRRYENLEAFAKAAWEQKGRGNRGQGREGYRREEGRDLAPSPPHDLGPWGPNLFHKRTEVGGTLHVDPF
ncbi:MAG TPA: hypothetical protein VKT32_11910, partial [Chthonomonadaceae bacterium]|nr:hypothetical protein [Chthonomonadaceae bacterium]